jgi:hypothetical protein
MWFKKGLSKLKKFEIKYVCECFDLRNNITYWNFYIFKMDFKLKSIEASMSLFQLKILETSEFDELCPTCYSLHLVANKINSK